ncbi:contactin-2 isoform X2 [Drosophila willistoni]|uniref:contactin-2 isoform X2 n=1 Tax=Drosophila willistoni TaxID=7260 RepID=UPI000C26D837|nr:contactin-2 isoform X2 [Drosophila willistoni]
MSSTPCSVLTLSSFNLLFFTQVLTVLSSAIKYNEYATDKGGNVSIPCIADGNIMWIKEHGSNNTIIQTGRILVLHNVSTTDSGIYVCFAALPRRITSTTTIITTTTTAIPATSTTTSSQDLSKIESETKMSEHRENQSIDKFASKSETNENKEQEQEEMEYQACQRTLLKVRTPPGPVSQLYFKASTILGFLIWRFNKTQSGGYPVRSFTAEYRNVSYDQMPANESYEHAWSRMDPINIAPNVRQMEVYRLAPNTTYEFRIWANNELGSGEVVTTNVTTLPETKEEDLIRLIKPDLDNFDPRIWIVAVSIVLGTLVILAIGLCIVLSKECYQSTQMDDWDSIELIPNIILNPGFSESDGTEGVSAPPLFIQHHHRQANHVRIVADNNDNDNDDDDDDDDDYEERHEPTMEKFKRKVSVFFTGPTIKRI